MVFNLGALLAVSAWRGEGLSAIFAGQSSVTTLLIVNNAAQGILSSFFYKYADTILKKYSSTIATIFTALMSWVLFGHSLTLNFMLGVSIVLISMHQFFTFGDKPAASHAKLHAEQLKGGESGLPLRSTPATGVGASLSGLEIGR
ncbi:hypothetical protein DUNSADRAFT_17740 [Dunaliella salina]|uniref:Nucleotide-sugar transporter n=1 Tax=Dunaliella salina TaxID=3046 RepID=A0ABQ7G173_DUNSA|nr:hypothetical protein DUNSADRAFT_17740 [Dunaliella salina]|eukprot:KAF5828357.1 hypothetical protein DUNSADRAFT_17740 [Dunaliella salina]